MIINFDKNNFNNFSRKNMKIHHVVLMELFDFIWEELEFKIQTETIDAKNLMAQNLKE